MRYQSLPVAPSAGQETTKEKAARQQRGRRAELTFNDADEQRWAENRRRVLAEREASNKTEWKPIEATFPLLVFQTKNKMDDFNAPDMLYGDESKEIIEQYGLMTPFEDDSINLPFTDITLFGEDQFSLPRDEHFKRMRSLASSALLGIGFSESGNTQSIFYEMVEKFKRNEGGYYSNSMLDNALKGQYTTAEFHKALKQCLQKNLQCGKLPNDILTVSSQYMMSSEGKPLPKFDKFSEDLLNGTVLTVHDIWSMRVYAESLEYKENQIRGVFRYEIQDHFGLDTNDINHSFSDMAPYEQLEGFRSWYLLQHFEGYGFQPFITEIGFEL